MHSTRPYKLIPFKEYVPIYPNPYAFIVGPPRGTVGVITRHVLSYNWQYEIKAIFKKKFPSVNPYPLS